MFSAQRGFSLGDGAHLRSLLVPAPIEPGTYSDVDYLDRPLRDGMS